MAFSNSPQYNTYQQKTIPFIGSPDPRNSSNAFANYRDEAMINVFAEAEAISQTGEKTLWLRKRAGYELVTNFVSGEVRASVATEEGAFFIIGPNLYKYDGGLSAVGLLHTSTGPCALTAWVFSGDGTKYLLASDGITLYKYAIVTNVFSDFATGYPTPHQPYIVAIDGYILLAKTGTADIYNSQLEDMTLAWDFISAEMYPDDLVGISRYNNYVAALGRESIELFYDAGVETGSPLQRNDSAVATIGCIAPRSMLQTDRNLFWIGTTQEGGFSVWMMVDFKPTEIGTAPVRQSLTAAGTSLGLATAYSCRIQGHHFYVIRLDAGVWVYDIDEKLWHQWRIGTGATWPFILGVDLNDTRYGLLQNDGLYQFSELAVVDASGPIVGTWQYDGMTFDTMNRKFLSRLTVIGNREILPTFIDVSWSDDDGVTWSTPRTINLSSFRPAIVNCGYFRRREFRFSHSSASLMRLFGFELTMNTGVS